MSVPCCCCWIGSDWIGSASSSGLRTNDKSVRYYTRRQFFQTFKKMIYLYSIFYRAIITVSSFRDSSYLITSPRLERESIFLKSDDLFVVSHVHARMYRTIPTNTQHHKIFTNTFLYVILSSRTELDSSGIKSL